MTPPASAGGSTPRPLEHCHIVSLALNVPGPVAVAELQSAGARVTKVEPPAGDPLREMCPAWYRELTQAQTVRRLNLKDPADRRALDDLMESADLLVTSFRPQALGRLALDWESVHARFPRICYVAIVGYSGPRSNEAGHDLTYQADAGLLNPPHLPRTLIADLAAGLRAAISGLTLLLRQHRAGVGGYTEVAIADALALFATPQSFGLTRPGGILGGALAYYNLYQSADGWVALAALEPHFRRGLQAEFGAEDLSQSGLLAIFRSRPSRAWEEWAKAKDVPLTAVHELDPADPAVMTGTR